MKKIIIEILKGIGWGSTLFLIIGIAIALTGRVPYGASSIAFVKQAICAVIAGIGFTLPSIVYDNDRLSFGIKALIHLGIGMTVYCLVAFYGGWMPVNGGIATVAVFIFLMIFVAVAIWFCFYIYYKKEAQRINDVIKQRK